MNIHKKVDYILIAALTCSLVTMFVCIDKVKHLNEIIKSSPVCEAHGLTEKTRAFDAKSKIFKMQCE